jgi:NTE family protein
MNGAKQRVGLVLGGGGPVGHAYHAGVLAALAEAGPWDARSAEIVVGTSAGAVVAALLRAGLGGADLYASVSGGEVSAAGAVLLARTRPVSIPLPDFEHADFRRGPASPTGLLTFVRRPWTSRPGALAAALFPAGRVPADPIRDSLAGLFPERWPDAATWICALRLDDGLRVIFARKGAGQASLAEAVAASCAVPAFFTPVEIGGIRYVDGGAWSATNVDVLEEHGLDVIVVSSPMSGLGHSPAAVAGAVNRFRLRREMAVVERKGVRLVLFEPGGADLAVMGSNFMDGRRLPEVARQARSSALQRLAQPEISAVLRTP